MNINEIQNTKEFKGDRNQCTVVASSVAFDIDYKKVHSFYLNNGRKKNRGLLPYHTERLINLLAKYEGYKVDVFRPKFITGNIRKWVLGENLYHTWANGKAVRKGFREFKTNAETLFTIGRHLTPNNQSSFLPKGNYIMGVSGHVIGIKNGIVNDWTVGRKHRAKVIYRIQKTGEKVKRQTFSDAFDDWMNFDF